MRVHVIALVCVFAVMAELAAASYHSLAWRHYKKQHGKVYEPEEDVMRFANFLATKQRVERHNANPNASFKMGLNHMADWSSEERKQLTNLRVDASKLKRTPLSANLRELMDKPAPKEVDWREQGRVTAVKNQKNCGSCWSFSTTGLLEGQQAKRNMSKLVPLSEQFLCDCSPNNNGCGGGLMDRALEDIAYLGGIQSEEDYPYEAVDNACRFDAKKYVMTVKGATLLGQGDEEALFKAVANYGPVSVAICVTQTFLDYDNGVLDDQTCSPQSLNHGVLVVGYGTDSQYGDYWIVKNSWSANWGERGYIRMKRGVNQCGIAEYATLADF